MSSYFYKDIPLPDYEQIIHCIHCGMCLPTCPTYELTGLEKHSPRGRIRLIKAIANGEMNLTENFKESINFCLDCQACVTACPAGVDYGRIVEAAQVHVAHHDMESGKASLVKKMMLDWLFKDMKHLRFVAKILHLYQKSGWQWIVQHLGILKIFSKKLHELSFMTPPVSPQWEYKIVHNRSDIEKKGIRVGMVIGCVQDIFFRDVNQDTLEVLNANGYEIYLPNEHVCCGSVHGHNGNLKTAKYLAKKIIDIYSQSDLDYIVSNSAGCGAYMKEYRYLFGDDPEYAYKAQNFSKKVKDITEILSEHGWRIPKTFNPLRVTYHEPCHLVHTQKVSQQPRDLIKSIPNVEFRELPESTWCCGSAGIYNITHYDDSMKILERKMKNIQSTGVSHVLTGNPGCMIQLMYGKKKFKVDVEIIHPISLLKMAYDHEMVNSE